MIETVSNTFLVEIYVSIYLGLYILQDHCSWKKDSGTMPARLGNAQQVAQHLRCFGGSSYCGWRVDSAIEHIELLKPLHNKEPMWV